MSESMSEPALILEVGGAYYGQITREPEIITTGRVTADSDKWQLALVDLAIPTE